jgi:hypothetical protein
LNSSNEQFFVSIKKITEIYNGEEIFSVSLSSVSFAKEATQDGANNVTTYSALLINYAFVNVSVSFFPFFEFHKNKKILFISKKVIQFQEQTAYEFAGTTTSYLPNSLKYTIAIKSWPFQFQGSSLSVVFDAGSTNQSTVLKPCHDPSENLQWIVLTVGDVSLYQNKQKNKNKKTEEKKPKPKN